MRRRVVIGGLFVVAAAGAGTVYVVRDNPPTKASAADGSDTSKLSYATVQKKDLTRAEDFTGRVGHGDQTPLKLTGDGLLTGLPDVGDVIDFGDQVAEVDGEPVLLLQGDRPAWRELGPDEFDGRVSHGEQTPLALNGDGTLTGLPSVGDVVDFGKQFAEVDGEPVLLLHGDRAAWRELGPNTPDGEDIRQLEAALVEMGYADAADLTVDTEWDADTTKAVKAMQAWNGMPVDGRLSPNEIVFSRTSIRIAKVDGHIGDRAGAAGIEVSAGEQSVEVTVPSTDIDRFATGSPVTIELPDGTEVHGTVASIGEPVAAEDGSTNFPVTVRTDPLSATDGTAVSVSLDQAAASGTDAADGEDVRQLEAALVALGYADVGTLTVDTQWDAETTKAVKALQAAAGMTVDGRLSPSEIVFSAEKLRIAAVGGHIGDAAASAGIEVSDLEQTVEATVKSSKIGLFQPGDAVTVTLPDDQEIDGTVASIGDAVVGEDGSATFPVDVSTPALDISDGTQVTITLDIVSAKDVTAVPAEALLALAEGGYAVEVPDASAPAGTRLVGVEIGDFADGWVEIHGNVQAGDKVVVP